MPGALEVRRADFGADYDAIRRVRFAVFVDEQRVPEALELDERDPECIHVLAIREGQAVGTGRIDIAQAGRIGRVAVLAAVRRLGVGEAVMQHLHDIAREQGLRAVWCNAQLTAVPFYAHLGYRASGPVFVEAGIDHVRMRRTL